MKKSLSLFLILLSVVVYGQKIDPNAVAQQYLSDLCTLDENKFVNKYMLTQADFLFLMKQIGKNEYVELADSLEVRAKVYKTVLQSYRGFQQSIDSIPALKIMNKYATCFYKLEYKNSDIRLLTFEDLNIHFKVDTNFYVVQIDELIQMNNHWIGGEFEGFYKTDSMYQFQYDYGVDEVLVDTLASVDYYGYDNVVDVDTKPSKKQQKTQKKIDAYYRKIDKLYFKQ